MSKKDLNKVIVALDLPREKEIKKIVNALYPQVKKFKVGLITYSACGPEIIRWIKKKGAEVFLDLKFFDIPNTMIEAAKIAVDNKVWAFTVHIKAGKQALTLLKQAVFEYAKEKKVKAPLIVGVTELTSAQASLKKVMSLAKIAHESDLEAVVCSVWEAARIKEEFDLVTITPGIRPALVDDQKRVAAFSDVLEQGADYCVVGRPIVKQKDPLAAAFALVGVKKDKP